MPVLCNLFGTPRRVALGMGQEDVTALREVGKLLAFLKEPEPLFMRPTRHGEAPGDQRCGIVRPALHDGNFGQIHRIAFQHFLLARRTAQAFGRHVQHVLNMPTKRLRGAPCQQKVLEGDAVDLTKIPIMQCWPEDAAPLITWGLTVTRGPHKERQNLGIYQDSGALCADRA